MHVPSFPWDNVGGHRVPDGRQDRQSPTLLALGASVVLHLLILKFGLAGLSWTSMPGPVMTSPLIVSLAPLVMKSRAGLTDTQEPGEGGYSISDAPNDEPPDIGVPPVATSRAISPLPVPTLDVAPPDTARHLRTDLPETGTGLPVDEFDVGSTNGLSGLALGAALDRRMMQVLKSQHIYIAERNANAQEDIVSRRARCLIVPFAFMGPERQSDSTITMPDPYCRPDPVPFSLDRARQQE